MYGLIVGLVSTEHGNGNIAVLDKTTAVQSAIKAVAAESLAATMLRFGALRIGPVSWSFTQQAKGLSHLRLSFIDRSGVFSGALIRSPNQPVGLVLTDEIFEAKF